MIVPWLLLMLLGCGGGGGRGVSALAGANAAEGEGGEKGVTACCESLLQNGSLGSSPMADDQETPQDCIALWASSNAEVTAAALLLF